MTLAELNQFPDHEARAALERCCGARAWADGMIAARPFPSLEAVLAEAERVWWALPEAAWRDAFAHHPPIGDAEALRRRFASTSDWAADEQQGATGASEATLTALAEGNRSYRERFGYIFIVCATGKSADEMLAMLRERLGHDPDTEIRNAAEEQMKITGLRLKKLLEVPAP